jgi:Cu(I)/Ag(I) efflux system membrane fusion protein/cobalt-zinc-cadmium efflux system membrane fusion protein
MTEDLHASNGQQPEPALPARKRGRTWLVLLLLFIAAIGASAYFYKRSSDGARAAEETAASSKPENTMAAMPTSKATPADSSAGAGQIYIAPERQQLIGVKTASAEMKSITKEIRTVGRVAYDETKITHVHTKVSGFIEDVFADYVGKPVKAGEPLFTIYSPDLVATQQDYLLALKSNALLKDSSFPWVSSGSNNLVEAAKQRLLLWDITPQEIQTLEQSGAVKHALTIQSHVSGVITERQAYHHGRYVTPEMDLYTIVDLSSVWVLGQVNESDLSSVRVGQMVQIELPYSSNLNQRQGRIVFISPILDPKTRAVEVRVEFPNPDSALKPDMFVNFKLNIPLGRQLAIPADALLDTGTMQYVFVDKGQGYFEPREVKVSARTEDVVAIETGLKAGEQVVTAANFIIDSESRLRGAFASMGEPSRVPVGAPAPGTQNLQVEVVEPKTAKPGSNAIRIRVRDSSGKPIEDAEVQVGLFMPQMGNMPPMSSDAMLKNEGGGVYSGSIQFLMAWTWETTVTAKKNGQVIGTAKTTITAR